MVRFGISPCFIKCELIPKCIHWFGRMALILIRPLFTTGQNTPRRLRIAHASGKRRPPKRAILFPSPGWLIYTYPGRRRCISANTHGRSTTAALMGCCRAECWNWR
jgi:hypothetical protein